MSWFSRTDGRTGAPARSWRNSTKSAFTLIELLAVIAIIAILAGIVIGVGRRAAESGKIAQAKAELGMLSAALEAYRKNYGDYPQTNDEAALLQALIGRRGPTNAVITARSLLDLALFATAQGRDAFSDETSRLIDPWGEPYVYAYKVPAAGWTNPGFVLYSVGPDGADAPGLLAGGYIDIAQQANADNIQANR